MFEEYVEALMVRMTQSTLQNHWGSKFQTVFKLRTCKWKTLGHSLTCDIVADICGLLKDAVCVFVHAVLKSRVTE
jgi:hypothetical protein